jgi:hypothetical protein
VQGISHSLIHFIRNFTARVSDTGIYTCQATVTSAFLIKPIVSNTAVTLTMVSLNVKTNYKELATT